MMNSTSALNNLTIVEQHIAREATDVDKAIELYTDDIVWESPSRQLIYQGKEAVAQHYRRMFSSIQDFEIRPLERFATANRVVDDALVRFILTGDGFPNAPVSVGSRVLLRLVHIFGMRDGKIERENVYETWSTLIGKGEHSACTVENSTAACVRQATGTFFSRCLDTLFTWQQRHRARRNLRSLLSLDDRLLADIGMDRFSIACEARKRFWEPPGPIAYDSPSSGPSDQKGDCADYLPKCPRHHYFLGSRVAAPRGRVFQLGRPGYRLRQANRRKEE
jgi:uncharacterized protein YjiS (DUF1127 family)